MPLLFVSCLVFQVLSGMPDIIGVRVAAGCLLLPIFAFSFWASFSEWRGILWGFLVWQIVRIAMRFVGDYSYIGGTPWSINTPSVAYILGHVLGMILIVGGGVLFIFMCKWVWRKATKKQ